MPELLIDKIMSNEETGRLYSIINSALNGSNEIILDFKNIKEIDIGIVKIIMSACLKHKLKGKIIKIRNMSFPVRSQFLLTGLDNAGDELIL